LAAATELDARTTSDGLAGDHFALRAPAGSTAGILFPVTVTGLDNSNSTATGYAGTASFTSSDSSWNA